MNYFYAFSTSVSLVLLIAIVVVLCCWPKRRGKLLLIIAFILKAIANFCFLISNIVIIPQLYSGNFSASDVWMQVHQYAMYFVQSIDVLGTTLILFGVCLLLLEFKKEKAAGSDMVTASPVTPKIASHNSGLWQGLGILGLFVWPVAIVVRYFASKDLAQMRSGKMDIAGEQGTKIAYVLGSIGSVLLIGVGLTLLMLFIVLQFEMV